MPLTPQDSRVIHAKPTIKLTPSLATHPRRSGSRSPTRSAKYEVNLSLRRVIGTTAASRNTIDSIPSRNTFAFTAGAAAVVATVHQDNQSVNDQITETNNGQKSFITQRFYRAPPILNASVTSPSSYGSPTSNGTPTHTRRVLREPNTAVNSPTHITSLSQAPEWVDSPTNKTWTSKDRIRAATAVALSPDGRFLAVGETGYKPRLLIFSRAESSSTDCPVSCLSEHAFSIRCLSFSSDSRYLASLGSPNDGFLHIWSINARTGDATLHSSNRCTSSVRQIAWMGRSLVRYFRRFFKAWAEPFTHF